MRNNYFKYSLLILKMLYNENFIQDIKKGKYLMSKDNKKK